MQNEAPGEHYSALGLHRGKMAWENCLFCKVGLQDQVKYGSFNLGLDACFGEITG